MLFLLLENEINTNSHNILNIEHTHILRIPKGIGKQRFYEFNKGIGIHGNKSHDRPVDATGHKSYSIHIIGNPKATT